MTPLPPPAPRPVTRGWRDKHFLAIAVGIALCGLFLTGMLAAIVLTRGSSSGPSKASGYEPIVCYPLEDGFDEVGGGRRRIAGAVLSPGMIPPGSWRFDCFTTGKGEAKQQNEFGRDYAIALWRSHPQLDGGAKGKRLHAIVNIVAVPPQSRIRLTERYHLFGTVEILVPGYLRLTDCVFVPV